MLAKIVGGVACLGVGAVAVTLWATAPRQPRPLAAVEGAASRLDDEGVLPPYETVTARDGVTLAHRVYPGRPGRGVAVLVHGSSGTSAAVQSLAVHLAAVGVTTYTPDLRGHGRSGRAIGDVAYVDQYQDDLAGLAQLLRHRHPGEKLILAGHSSGGTLALRTAGNRSATAFDGFLAISPFIAPGPPLSRPDEGGWTSVSVPRMVVLSVLNGFGVRAFDGLTVLAMAVPPGAEADRPRRYSFRLLSSLNLPRDWSGSLARIRRPTRVLIGGGDELFVAAAYPASIRRANAAIRVDVLPRVGHMSMLYDTNALEREVAAALDLLSA